MTELPLAANWIDGAWLHTGEAGDCVDPATGQITVAGALKSRLPMIPGRDFAGIIAGPDAGMEVWASGTDFRVTRDGASAEYVAIPRRWLAAKPMEEAAACCLPFIVAQAALVDAGGTKRDEMVLVTGADGAVGNAAIQIVHLHGARVIGIQQTGHASGADHIVDTKKQDLTEAVRDSTVGRGIDLAFDTVGGDLFEPVLKTVKACGRQVVIATGKHRVEFDLFDFYRSQLSLFGVNTLAFSGERSFVSGDLKPPAVRSLPFEEAPAAYGYVNAGGSDRQVMVP